MTATCDSVVARLHLHIVTAMDQPQQIITGEAALGLESYDCVSQAAAITSTLGM